MEDLVFVLATVAFFALAAAYVRFCDGVVGPDDPEASGPPPQADAGATDTRPAAEVTA